MSTLGNNIRMLRKQRKLNQLELAEKLGVSQTSVAHYEAGTRQPSIETLMLLSNLFDMSIDKLLGNKNVKMDTVLNIEMTIIDLVDKLVDYLVIKDEESFLNLFRDYVYPKYSPDKTLDSILKIVMYKLGDLWAKGMITEADEHYATDVVRRAINYMTYQESNSLKHQKALLVTAGSEKHTLGLEMINAYLRTKGIESIYLGSDLPIRSIDKLIEDYLPDYIFISVTIRENMNSMEYLIDHFTQRFGNEIQICVGGQGLQAINKINQMDNVHILKDIDDVRDFIEKE